uniref:Glycosyltransferase n=1 Tax=viral metagenome TaxID=1070528 RepID=A0A6H1Z9G2_9ZZZZ
MIGVVINVDTRPGYLDEHAYCGGLTGGGGRSIDFMTDNVVNKIKFFNGYDIELTLYVDLHEMLTPFLRDKLYEMQQQGLIQNLIFAKNSHYFMGKVLRQWHDSLYLNALILSRGKYVAHFDGDTSAFRKEDCHVIKEWIEMIESGKYKMISYPTIYSPNEGNIPGINALPPSQGGFDYLWASTRFFFCRRDFIDYNAIIELFNDNTWIKRHNGRPHRYPNVTEQILGFLAGPGQVCYPPKKLLDYMMFSWHDYYLGTIGKLNELPYPEVHDYIMKECGGINGACDVCQHEPMRQ